MAKSINRVVMIFFVLVISCLIALGCVNALQVVDGSSKTISTNAGNNITTEVNSDSYYSNDITQNKNALNYNIPSTDSEYILTCNCPAGTACTCGKLAEIWSKAMQESLDTSKNVKVTLDKDWIAKKDGTDTTFGSTFAFSQGRIAVAYGSEITLDLNGHSIDRNFDQVASSTNGSAIIIMGGTLNLYDSKYDESAILKCYNDNKDDESNLVEKLKSLQVGLITGGWTPGNGGGILAYSANGYSSKLNMYNGLIIGNQANRGGGIYAYENSNINIYDGIIACNKAASGGGIYMVQSTCDIYKINMMGNIVTSQAGGIYATTNSNLTVDNFDIFDNTASSGGAMYIQSYSVVDVYTGKIHHNTISKGQNSLAIGCGTYSVLNIYDADIYENQGSYGTLFVVGLATINFYGGKIHNNHADNSGGIDCNNGHFNMYGGEVYDNDITTSGSFLYLLGAAGEAKIYAGKIYNNHTANTNNGAIYINSTAQLWLGAGAQIYDNTAGTDNHPADVFLFGTQKINILERMINSTESSHVGVTLRNYTDDTFTHHYSVYNSDVNPSLYFFMSNSTQGVKILDGEVAVDDTTNKPTQMVEWYWSDTQKTTLTNVTLPYTGSNYVIKSSLSSFWSVLESKTVSQYEIKNVGTYSFCVGSADVSHAVNYINPVFTVTIAPKVVDLVWDTSLTYNGYPQSPTAVVKQGSLLNADTCTVNVSGSAQNVGTGYVAKATSLSNSNYKINSTTNSTYYSINPATLTINIATNNKSIMYNGQKVELNDWLNITHNAVGIEHNKSIDSIFDIDYSKIIPQFIKDSVTTDSAVNVGEYAISVKPFNVNEVFSGNSNYNVVINYVNGGTLSITESQVIRPSVESQYEYLVLEDDKRVAYSEKGLVHGENDSNVNISNGKANYYLGNIAPNTSVNKFISNLVYDKTQIQIYNNKEEIIYNRGNAEVSAELLDNGIELAIGTGWYIEYMVGSNTERITLSVLGDINGDGRISAKDVATLREIANNKAVYNDLSVENKLASMIVNKGGVTTADAEIVRNVIDKLFDINLFF